MKIELVDEKERLSKLNTLYALQLVVVRPVQTSLQQNAQVSMSVFRRYGIASNLVVIIEDITSRTVELHYDTL